MKGVFGFEEALLILKSGGRVKRLAWPQHRWLRVVKRDLTELSIQVRDLVVTTPEGDMEYSMTTYDMLAGDWTADINDLPKEQHG